MNTEADMAAPLGGACRGKSATSGVNRRRPAWRWVRATEAAGAQHRRSIAAGLTARWRRREAFLGRPWRPLRHRGGYAVVQPWGGVPLSVCLHGDRLAQM